MADDESSQIPPTQLLGSELSVSGNREYNDLVLFNWKPGLKDPFKMYPLDLFNSTQIREKWIKFQMIPSSRIRPLKALNQFPGEMMSLFGKVERGIYYII